MPADSYVIDTSVVARWFLKQDGWREAREYRDRFVRGDIGLETTWCARFELPHVLRRHGVLSGNLSVEHYRAGARAIDDLGIVVEPMGPDELEQCAVLAYEKNLSFFDAVFVFRALLTGLPLLTADNRLSRAADGLVDIIALG